MQSAEYSTGSVLSAPTDVGGAVPFLILVIVGTVGVHVILVIVFSAKAEVTVVTEVTVLTVVKVARVVTEIRALKVVRPVAVCRLGCSSLVPCC